MRSSKKLARPELRIQNTPSRDSSENQLASPSFLTLISFLKLPKQSLSLHLRNLPKTSLMLSNKYSSTGGLEGATAAGYIEDVRGRDGRHGRHEKGHGHVVRQYNGQERSTDNILLIL